MQDLEDFLATLKKALITLEELDHLEKGIDYFETFIRYIMNARRDLTIIDVCNVAKEISLERSCDVMTIAEQLISEGMEKGIEKGIEKGMEKGMEKGIEKGIELVRIETAKEMLLDHEPLSRIMKYSKLTEEQINELAKQMKH